MEQIKIGTCIPGQQAEQWLPGMKDKGFECFAINFHMTYGGVDLKELAPKVLSMLEGTGTYVSTVGYYCNALQNESQLHDLEYAIDNAHLFGAKTVATFAGALEGQPVDAAIPRFKEVFSELAKRAEDRGVKLAIENCPMSGDWRHPTCNIGFNPDAWELMFDAVPSDALGLEWEPAHQLIQLIDPIPQLRKWVHKVYHMHGKDATVDMAAVREYATVESILRNEKYKGSALLQKSFTVDFLTKKTKINEGEVPQYYVEDSHPAIIEPWEWEQVQVELERRKNSRNRHHQTSPFSGKIICADCGDIFGAKTWHSTDRYRRVIWQCNGKFKGERKCETPHLTEERLKDLYLVALGEYLSDRDAAIDQLRYAQRMLTDTDFIDADIQALEEELTTITGMLRLCIAENAANTMTEETYRTTHAELCNRFEETEAKLAALQKQRDKMKADAITIGGMMFELGELDALPLTFDEKLWHGTIDHVTVHADERVVFHFKDGKEIVTRL